MRQAYRFALDPTPVQEEFLASCAGASRYWFNAGLALVKERLEARAAGKDVDLPWSYKGLCSVMAPLKDTVCPWRSEVVVGSQQAGLEALGRALQNFSRARAQDGRRVGFPRFRRKGACHEAIVFQRPRITDARHVLLDRRLGPLRTREPMRKLVRLFERDPQARIVRSTVQRAGRGWVISFAVERGEKERHAARPDEVVGVDLGLTALATLSTGEKITGRKPLGEALSRLRRLQRKLDRQRRAMNPANYDSAGRALKGRRDWARSGRMRETKRLIARAHERVANLRRERAHQLTSMLTRTYGVIGVETLAVENLKRNRRLGRHISDAGWGMILSQLAYKTDWAGGLLVPAGRYYPSSKTCSSCGSVKAKLGLGERVFTCTECGHRQDRDQNAAINLAMLALAQAHEEGRTTARLAPTDGVRRGQVRPHPVRHRPVKREEQSSHEDGSPQRREALAIAH